MCRTLLIME